MAAFTGTPVDSTYQTNQEASNRDNNKRNDPRALKVHHFPVYTHAAAQGAGTGEINIGTLPQGEITIYPDLSRYLTSQFGASATMDIGHRAYTQPDGTAVAEAGAVWGSAIDVNGAATDAAWPLPAGPTVYDSVSGIEVFCTVAAGDIEVGDTIEIVVVYASAT